MQIQSLSYFLNSTKVVLDKNLYNRSLYVFGPYDEIRLSKWGQKTPSLDFLK